MTAATPQQAPLVGIASAALDSLQAPEICRIASGIRVDGIEWGIGDRQVLGVDAEPGDVAAVTQAAAGFGLQCCGVSVHDGDALLRSDAVWEWLAQTATALQAPHIRVYAPPPDAISDYGGFDAALGDLQTRIADHGDRLSRYGLKLLIEPSPRTLIPGPSLARDALAKADQTCVGVVYDPGSLAQEGWLAPFLAVSILGRSLRHVHVKNVAPQHHHGRWSWTYERLRAGIVDWERAIAELQAADYEGWYVLDHLSSARPGALAADIDDLRRLLAPTE